jgi:vancomycin resistance protein YoaR
MSYVIVPKAPPRVSIFSKAIVSLLTGCLLFLLFIVVATGAYALLFSGRIFPGVNMAGVDLSSLTPQQATQALNQRLTFPANGHVILRYGDKAWPLTPAQLGMVFDAGRSVQLAYDLGRKGGPFMSLATQLNAWQGGIPVSPVIQLDERVAHGFLQNIASEINLPVVEADLRIEGTQVVYVPGQTGRSVNVDKTLAALIAQLDTFKDGEVQLIVEEESPLILDASAQAAELQQALTGPLTISVPDAQAGDPVPWTIDVPNLAGLLTVGKVQLNGVWQYQVTFDQQPLEQYLSEIAPQLDRQPKNARFYFDDPTRQLVLVEHSTSGRSLNISASTDAIVKGILQGQHNIPLVVDLTQPAVPDNATAASLGITNLVSSYTSYFRGSGGPRLQNIKAASERFYGLLIPPNATFSMGDAIGDISLDNGYAEALIIYNGKTITGVGGGVCQVSTTLFRTALYGGYPIVERHYHAYRVYYYEQTASGTDPGLAGLDATVYFPLVDLKFTNDRSSWLLMETYFDPGTYSLTWKFYSGDDGRTTEVQNQGLENVVPAPAPRFEEDPSLGANEMRQVDWPGDGADIMVVRTVTRAGQVIINDTIPTHYEPWQAVCLYGPGTDNPEELAAQLGLCQ